MIHAAEDARREAVHKDQREAAERIAKKNRCTVGAVYLECSRAERAQREWMRTLAALGYKAGDCPVAFLRRVNAKPRA